MARAPSVYVSRLSSVSSRAGRGTSVVATIAKPPFPESSAGSVSVGSLRLAPTATTMKVAEAMSPQVKRLRPLARRAFRSPRRKTALAPFPQTSRVSARERRHASVAMPLVRRAPPTRKNASVVGIKPKEPPRRSPTARTNDVIATERERDRRAPFVSKGDVVDSPASRRRGGTRTSLRTTRKMVRAARRSVEPKPATSITGER